MSRSGSWRRWIVIYRTLEPSPLYCGMYDLVATGIPWPYSSPHRTQPGLGWRITAPRSSAQMRQTVVSGRSDRMDDRVKTLFPLPPQISPILCLYVLRVWCEAGSSRSTDAQVLAWWVILCCFGAGSSVLYFSRFFLCRSRH